MDRNPETIDEVSTRLLKSAAIKSFNPREEIDWDAALEAEKYGLPPEWCSLYKTKIWDEMSETQRLLLTRHEVANIMGLAIMLESCLQQIFIRSMYFKDPASAEWQFSLNEIADESEHSLMFAKAGRKLAGTLYPPPIDVLTWGWLYKTFGRGDWVYGIVLAGEEILDVMQRAWAVDERVEPLVRTTSKIHVIEEARHMKFARMELKKNIANLSKINKKRYAFFIAVGTHILAKGLVNKKVYKAVGLDPKRAKHEVDHSAHHQTMLKIGMEQFMAFLSEIDLLTPTARWIYKKSILL